MNDSEDEAATDVKAGGEFADQNPTITCTTCLAEVRPDNIARHFDWHIDVGHHTDDAQRERTDTSDDETSSGSDD